MEKINGCFKDVFLMNEFRKMFNIKKKKRKQKNTSSALPRVFWLIIAKK